MKDHLIIDGHTDVAFNILHFTKKDFFKEAGKIAENKHDQIDMDRLRRGGVDMLFGASFLLKSHAEHEGKLLSFDDYRKELDLQIKTYEHIAERGKLEIVYDAASFEPVRKKEKKGILLHVEGCYQIETLEDVETMYKKGIRSACLTWNVSNKLAGGSGTDDPLTAFGAEAIDLLHEKKFILDLAHIGETSFWDIIDHYKAKPIVVTHGNCKVVHDHKRNYTDKQIRAIAETGGVIGMSAAVTFLAGNKMEDLLAHFDHAVRVGGEDAIAIGTDFDGMMNPLLVEGFASMEDFPNLIAELEKRFSDRVVEKILGDNWARVIKDTL
jgi:membrane dipeptidase